MDTPTTSSQPSAISLTHASIQRLASQSASCKITSAVLSGAAMLFAAGRAGGDVLLWAAAPMGLLAIADASYAAKTRRLADSFHGNTSPKLGDLLSNEVGRGGMDDLAGTFRSLLSFSVWPYYTSLAVLVAGLGTTVLLPKTLAPNVVSPFNAPAGLSQMHPSGQPNPVFQSNNLPRPFPQSTGGQPASSGGAPTPGVSFPQTPGRALNRIPGTPGAPVSGAPNSLPSNRLPGSPTIAPNPIKPPSVNPSPAPKGTPSALTPPSAPTPVPAPTAPPK